MSPKIEEFNMNVKKILNEVTDLHDGPEDKFVVISRLVKLARTNGYPVGPDCVDYIAEVIMIVQEEWED